MYLQFNSRLVIAPPSPASSSKALARSAAAVQLRASAAAKHRHSNRATLASIAPLRRATAALSRVEPQPPWPIVAQLAAKPGAALPQPRALAHRQCCAAKALPRRATAMQPPASTAVARAHSGRAAPSLESGRGSAATAPLAQPSAASCCSGCWWGSCRHRQRWRAADPRRSPPRLPTPSASLHLFIRPWRSAASLPRSCDVPAP